MLGRPQRRSHTRDQGRPTIGTYARGALLVVGVSAVLACGFRTDHEGELICVEPGADDGTDGTDTGGEPISGSCEAPIELPWLGVDVSGNLGGCGEAEGWCGGNGGEDYYKVTPLDNALDVVVEFDPAGTDIDPLFRVVRLPAGSESLPCALDELDELEAQWDPELICAPIVTGDARYAFFAQPGFDYYMIVDSYAGASGSYKYRFEYGVASLGDLCLQNVPDDLLGEQTLGPGQSMIFDGELQDKQGHFDHGDLACSAPGHEHIIPISLTGAGTLTAEVISWDGSDPPVLGLTQGCSPNLELDCSAGDEFGSYPLVSGAFNTAIETFLVIDQAGVEGGRYSVQVSLN